MQGFGNLLELLLLAHATTGHQNQTLGPTTKHGTIVGNTQRSGINNNVIILGQSLLDHNTHGV